MSEAAAGWRVYETVAVKYGVPKSYRWEAWTPAGSATGHAQSQQMAQQCAANALRELRAWAALR